MICVSGKGETTRRTLGFGGWGEQPCSSIISSFLHELHNTTMQCLTDTRLFAHFRNFTLFPLTPTQRLVRAYLWYSLLHRNPALIPRWQTLSHGRSAPCGPPSCKHSLRAQLLNSSMYPAPHPSHHARLLRFQCQHAGAYLDTVPVNLSLPL
jgi:hypothetical protein